ncbi:hypothetical protein L7F22_012506 [Adiantum nelumboides]|nr:hypothetical protein [Adiantum nelumboides]
MASGEGQSNSSTSGDAGGDHNEDFGNENGPPLPTQEELREMEHRRLVGEATNLMLNFAKDPKLAKYMSETAFQDVQAQWKATTTSPPKPDSKKQYSEKELEEEIDARLARILGAQKQGKKHDRKRKKSTDFPGYLGSQSTFDKAKKHKKRAVVPSSSSSSDSSSESSEEEIRSKKRSKRHRHGKGKRKTRKSKSRQVDDSSIEDSSTDSSDSEDGHFYANKKNFYKANQYDFHTHPCSGMTHGTLYGQARKSRRNSRSSPRVSNTLSNATARRSVSMDDEEKLQKEEFEQIFKEVQKLGTSQMSWKKRKEIETQKIVSLGAKPEKGQKMPVAMGRNIKRKRERMEEQKRQDELASGLLTTKRAKRGAEKPVASDRGLKASEGVFRGGVLYVKPLSTKTEENTQPSRGKKKSFRKGKKSKHKGKRKKR